MPEGSKNLVVNAFLTGQNSDTGPEMNYVSTPTNPRPIPAPWQRTAGGLRVEDISYPLMSSKRTQLAQPNNTNVIGLAGDTTAGGGLGTLSQDITLKRGGYMVARFNSCRNLFGTCYTTEGIVSVSVNGQHTEFTDTGGASAAASNWESRQFIIDTPIPGPLNNCQLSFSAIAPDRVRQDCGSIISSMELHYLYAAQGVLTSPASEDDIIAKANGNFPVLTFLISEGDSAKGDPGTPLSYASVDFSISQNGSGTAFHNNGVSVYTYTAVCDDKGYVTIPAGILVAGNKAGSEVLTLTVEEDIALSSVGVTIRSGTPPVFETMQSLTSEIDMVPTSQYIVEPIQFEVQYLSGGVMADLSGASVTVQITQNDTPITSQGNPYFKEDGSDPAFEITRITNDGGTITTPALYSSVLTGAYKIHGFLTDYPDISADIDLTVLSINRFDPTTQNQEATWGTTVNNSWSVIAYDKDGKPAVNQPVQFRISQDTGDASFVATGTREATGVSDARTGKVVVPALLTKMTPGTFRIRITGNTGTPLAQINVTVLENQIPAKIEFHNPLPDLSSMAGQKLYPTISVGITDINGQDLRSGQVNFALSGSSANSAFISPPAGENVVDIDSGIAIMPTIIIGTSGTLIITASMDNYNLSVSHDFSIN
ncbi:MAG: hypothetical protein PW790_10990 [Parvibaculaceae bacterium]|nr:hypothetical protein [Parvibaculaceae bacterium]